MRTVTVTRFDGGMTNDIYGGSVGQFSVAKHFDILTYPNRLIPLRGMSSDTANTGIGNIIISSTNGLMFGVGTGQVAQPTWGVLWQRSGYGASDLWQQSGLGFTNQQYGNSAASYPLLVDWPTAGNTQTIIWATANLINSSDPVGASSPTRQALTFTTIGQGFVHPADQILYFPYTTASNSYIAAITPNATPFAGLNTTALTLPKQYQVYGLCSYGNYLAVPGTSTNLSSVSASRVFFWNRDTVTLPVTWDYDISWGNGDLQVLNNLNGTLIGISANADNGASGAVQDRASISIKGYEGGAVFPVAEIAANHLASSSAPSVTINPRVNFIKNNRLYFSVNVVPNDGMSNSYYGLWSVGKNAQGRYTLNLERVATNANTETGVIAAAIAGDFVCMVHSAVGTLTFSTNGQTSSTTYGATSVYESLVNPDMPFNPHRGVLDPIKNKKLVAVAAHTLPLTTGQQVVMKVRVDSTNSADWKTLFIKTPTSPDATLTVYETQIFPAMAIPDGRNFEFRLESTGGAQITGFSYKYEIIETNL